MNVSSWVRLADLLRTGNARPPDMVPLSRERAVQCKKDNVGEPILGLLGRSHKMKTEGEWIDRA